MNIESMFNRAVSLDSVRRFEKERAMSNAQKSIIEQVTEISTEELKALAIDQFWRMDESSNAAFETALAELSGGDDRTQTAFDLLLKLKEDRVLLTVYTKFKIYTNMALKSVNLPRDSGVGDSIKFKMEFINVRLVDTQTVDVPPGISKKLDKKSGADVQKKTEPPKDAGKVEPKPVEKSKGILKGILG